MTAVTETWELVPRRRWLSLPARWRNPIGLVGAGVIALVVFTALFGHFIWTIDPDDPVYDRLQGPSWAHPMGTDDLGRDTLARIIHGAGVSLQVGATAIGIALVAGTIIGLTAGYYRGGIDLVLMRVVDMLFAFPGLILAFLIAGLLGPSRRNAMIAIGVILTPAFARVVRAAVLEVMGFPYVESARALGGGDLRIMARHVVPNIVAPLTCSPPSTSPRRSSPRRRSATSASAPSRRRRRGATCSRPRASSSTRASGCRSSRASRS